MPVSIGSTCLESTMMLPHYTNATGGRLSHLPLLLISSTSVAPLREPKRTVNQVEKRLCPARIRRKLGFIVAVPGGLVTAPLHRQTSCAGIKHTEKIYRKIYRLKISARRNFSELDFADANSRTVESTGVELTSARF